MFHSPTFNLIVVIAQLKKFVLKKLYDKDGLNRY